MLKYQYERLEGVTCSKKNCPFYDVLFEQNCSCEDPYKNPMPEKCADYIPTIIIK